MYYSSTVLSRLQGAGFLGAAPAYALGGFITLRFGTFTCLAVGAILVAINIAFTMVFLPETLGEAGRVELSDSDEAANGAHQGNPFRQIFNSTRAVFAPLVALVPLKDSVTGRRDPRLMLFGFAVFLYYMGNTYVANLLLAYGTTVLRLTPADVSESYRFCSRGGSCLLI